MWPSGRAKSVLSDTELDAIVRELRSHLPYSEQIVIGHMRSIGHYTTNVHVRESIRRTDPLNTPLRWGGDAHQRRPYSVPGPNLLWHLGLVTMYVCIPEPLSKLLSLPYGTYS